MRLIKAKVSGYKRLADNCELSLETDPVCIVGPNGAGKTSFLDALEHLNHGDPFGHTEGTRVPGGQNLIPAVEARFALEKEDLGLLKDIPEAANVRQLMVIKRGDVNGLRYRAEPYPSRDLSLRRGTQTELEELRDEGWLPAAQKVELSLDAPPEPSTAALYEAAAEFVGSDDERLEQRTGDLAALAERLNFIANEIQKGFDAADSGSLYEGADWPPLPKSNTGLPANLTALATDEGKEHPHAKVARALAERVPRFVKFDEQARRLGATYDLSGDVPPPEAAIHNFLALAGTSWAAAVEVVQSGDKGRKKVYEENMDRKLRERAALIWRQSDIQVQVDLDGPILTILLSMQAHDFIDLEQHSEGLKHFMALRAFVWPAENEIKPIVLIDEADLHLHYDAQADLVGVFEEQQEAQKIIYTTHSAGCLPRDLGLGLRAIAPRTEEKDGRVVQSDHSRAIDRFWTEGRGIAPLLLAMGAGAFAFSATQRAVITEGMSDALLLPSLIREATGKAALGYQAVPSFAEASAEEIAKFDVIAGKTAFLADGDDGGRRHVAKLKENGIPAERILFLGGGEASGMSIEDCLDEEVYLTAVNKELDLWHGLEFPAGELPKTGRGSAVAKWCAQQTGRSGKGVGLSKVDVAQRVLDRRSLKQSLLDPAFHEDLRALDEEITQVLGPLPADRRPAQAAGPQGSIS